MLEKLLNLQGVQALNKEQQQAISGGASCADPKNAGEQHCHHLR